MIHHIKNGEERRTTA
jgi:uncharacterized protein Veg